MQHICFYHSVYEHFHLQLLHFDPPSYTVYCIQMLCFSGPTHYPAFLGCEGLCSTV